MSDLKLYMLDARVLKLHSFKLRFAISHELADLKHRGTVCNKDHFAGLAVKVNSPNSGGEFTRMASSPEIPRLTCISIEPI